MITLTAKINLLSGDNTALSLGSNNLSGNNVSCDLDNVIGVKKDGSNPFIINASKLGDNSTFFGVNYEKFNVSNFEDEGIINGVFWYWLSYFNLPNGANLNNSNVTSIIVKAHSEDGENFVEELVGNSFAEYFFGYNEQYYLSLSLYAPFTYWIIDEITATITYNKSNIGYFIGNQLSDKETGLFDKNYTIRISSGLSVLDNITIEFDKSNNRHPNKIIVNGQEYIDDDAIFTITGLSTNNIYIQIDNWNAKGYPIVITGIYTSIDIEIDRRNLISIESSIFDRSDLKLPSFGIISNTGNIEFNDLNGEIRDYAEQSLLEKGLRCEIKLNNTLVDGASETIGVFETDEWNYENDNRLVSVSLKDDLEEWQDINVPEISYDPRNPASKRLRWFYDYLWTITTANGKYDMLAFEYLDTKTKEILENTLVQYPLLKSGSLWQQWTKLCQVGQSHIYKNKNGVIVCRYNGGN